MESVYREIYGNIDPLSKGIFYLLTFVSLVVFAWGVWRKVKRWRDLLPLISKTGLKHIFSRIAGKVLRQKALRQGGRKWVGLVHAMLFYGFLMLFIGTCLVSIEHYAAAILGRVDPLFHKGWYYIIFEVTLDLAGLLLVVGCLVFVVRRWTGKSSVEYRLSDWLVVLSLLFLGMSGYLVEGFRILLEDRSHSGVSPVGYLVAILWKPMEFSREFLSLLHLVNWWLHTIVALAFIAGLPYCRLFHIFAAPLNIALSDYNLGVMEPVSMESVEETGKVGIASTEDLTGKQWLALDACLSCGRCQDVCPAHIAGKPLSPRNVVQDTLKNRKVSGDSLWACTTCHACVTACPVDVAPLEFITELRRNRIAEGEISGAPAVSLQKMQRSGNPWGFSSRDRLAWADGLSVKTVKENPDFDVLYWVGCSASYDPRIQEVARATVQLLNRANVNFACLGEEEKCSGDSARRMGDEFLFQELVMENIETLNRYKVRKIVTHCPHCLNTLSKDYPQFGGHFEVQHHTQFIAELMEKESLPVSSSLKGAVTYHDPCYLSRVNGIIDEPRNALLSFLKEDQLREMPRNGCSTACCGGGGGRMWFDDTSGNRTGNDRVVEAIETGAETIAVSCPFCLTMMKDGVSACGSGSRVMDVAEILWKEMK